MRSGIAKCHVSSAVRWPMQCQSIRSSITWGTLCMCMSGYVRQCVRNSWLVWPALTCHLSVQEATLKAVRAGGRVQHGSAGPREQP